MINDYKEVRKIDKLLISSKPIEIAEHKNYKLATFLISVLDEYNENGVLIPKAVGEKYYETIVGFPIVAKLITDADNNPVDFRGHEVSIQNGNYRFNTMPIGSVLKSYIEEREVDGYDGVKSCIMIQAKLWSSRYPEYFDVLDTLWSENNVSSSWEISVEKSEPTIKGKILKVFEFIGNCVLGRTVDGAVRGAGMIEYAENNTFINEHEDEIKLAKALSNDCVCKEVKKMENENKEITVSENEVIETETITEEISEITETGNIGETDIKTEEISISAITIEDLGKKLGNWIETDNRYRIYGYLNHVFIDEKYFLTHDYKMNSLEFYKFTFDIVNGEIVINETPEKVTLVVDIMNVNSTIASKDEEIIKINSEMENLKSQITELSEIKEKYNSLITEKEKVEKAEKIKGFKAKAISSGYISEKEIETSEEISTIISNLDEVKLNSIIVDRIIKDRQKEKIENAEIKNSENININLSSVETEDTKTSNNSRNYRNVIKEWIEE